MKRGEIWWTSPEERVALVVLACEGDDVRGMRIVPPAQQDLTGIAIELAIGAQEGLTPWGVVRVALPQPGRILCTWLCTVPARDLAERIGELSSVKLAQLEEMLRVAGLD